MPVTKSYLQPKVQGEFDLEVKKSRFLVRYCAITNKQQGLQWLAHWREFYPDARHHCWGLLIGQPDSPSELMMSDDGEPSGTAGRPIINAIQGKQVGNICVVVVRYFGGTKLGAGGLIRAYGGAVSQALDRADYVEIKPKLRWRFIGSFAVEQSVRYWLQSHAAELLAVEYGQDVEFTIAFDLHLESECQRFLASQGIYQVALLEDE